MKTMMAAAAGAIALGSLAAAQAPGHVNPVIALLEQKKPVFGIYVPGSGRPGSNTPARPAAELAREGLGYANADFLFNGSPEESVDRALPAIAEFVRGMDQAGAGTPLLGLRRPLILKTAKIAPDQKQAAANIGRELNLGAAGIMFVETESAAEVRAGLAAMRFRSKGGTRSDDVGDAARHWGMSEQEYKQRADLWPLNPGGELINWTIVESREGLAHVREIAAVKGIGVLWPGAGTLRGVFTTTNASGEKVFDAAGWENAIQQVLAACKEFNIPCGYPANASDMEMRMKQGFSVFVSGWGEQGFKAIDIGRRAAGRAPTER